MTIQFLLLKHIKKDYPGKRPQTVGGAKGDENSGGDDEDDDTYEST